MFFKLKVQQLNWEGALEGVDVNYVQTNDIERLEDRGKGEWYIYFHRHGLLVHEDDPGVKEMLDWFESVTHPKPTEPMPDNQIPF